VGEGVGADTRRELDEVFTDENQIIDVNSSALIWEEWHRCMVHIGYSGLCELYHQDMIANLQLDTRTPKPDCIACVQEKLHTRPFDPAVHNPMQIGKLTHIDLWGKYDTASIHRN